MITIMNTAMDGTKTPPRPLPRTKMKGSEKVMTRGPVSAQMLEMHPDSGYSSESTDLSDFGSVCSETSGKVNKKRQSDESVSPLLEKNRKTFVPGSYLKTPEHQTLAISAYEELVQIYKKKLNDANMKIGMKEDEIKMLKQENVSIKEKIQDYEMEDRGASKLKEQVLLLHKENQKMLKEYEKIKARNEE